MRDDLRLCGISYKNVMGMWDVVQDMIVRALKHSDGKYTIFDVQYALLTRDMQLWVVADSEDEINAVIITQIVSFPSKKVLFFLLVSGVNFNDWNHFLPHFKLFAKDHQCSAMEALGRVGWEKKIIALGFKRIHTVFSLPI